MAQVNLGHVVGPGVPTGGTANQVLVKNGSTNFDASWKDASQLPAISGEATARDAADAALANGLAIIANGDTHAAVAEGQAVFVRSHSTLAAGLYWARSAIGTNAALSTANLTADASGGLNKLKGDIDSLNSNISSKGQRVDLGVLNAEGNFTLNDSIDNYEFIFIMLGYYNSGYANYGNALIPVSCIQIDSDSVYSIRVNGQQSSGASSMNILFTSKTTVNVTLKNNINAAHLWGIK